MRREKRQIMVTGETITSANGAYWMVMQGDCHLVVYTGGTPVRWSGTAGQGGSCVLVMQEDGNAVIYSGGPIWATGAVNYPNDYTLILGNDGVPRIYSGGVTRMLSFIKNAM